MSITSNSNAEVDFESIAVESITNSSETLRLLQANDPCLDAGLIVSMDENDTNGHDLCEQYFFYPGRLSTKGKEICFGWISHFLRKCTHLKSFTVTHAPGVFGTEDAAKLFHGLNENSTIEYVSLDEVRLEVFLPLLAEFAANKELKGLGIVSCNWRGDEFEYLRSIIHDCSNIRDLSIGSLNNGEELGVDELEAMATVTLKFTQELVSLHRLKRLFIDAMFLNSAACEALGSFIKKSSTLIRLGLDECYIGDTKKIAGAVATNIHIKNLSFHKDGSGHEFAGLGDEGAGHFANAMSANRTLKVLNLYGNGITARGWNLFQKPLCNTATICDTYNSNHVLQQLIHSTMVVCERRISKSTRTLLQLKERIAHSHLMLIFTLALSTGAAHPTSLSTKF